MDVEHFKRTRATRTRYTCTHLMGHSPTPSFGRTHADSLPWRTPDLLLTLVNLDLRREGRVGMDAWTGLTTSDERPTVVVKASLMERDPN
jgi:hypothetical protein